MGFEQLIAIGETAKQMRREDDDTPIVDCPECGHKLDSNGKFLNCPFGHGSWPEGTTWGALLR